jgi:hypothetical protein
MLDPKTQAALERLALYPRVDQLEAVINDPRWTYRGDVGPGGSVVPRADLAPMMIERLRYVYAEILEAKYEDLPAASGELFPIDDSVPSGAEEWRSDTVECTGFAQFVDEDGRLSPNGSASYGTATGRLLNIARKWSFNTFHLESMAYAKVPIESMRGVEARRSIEALTNWCWMFGDAERGLSGCFNHPNVARILAPPSANAGTPRAWSGKTNAEIAADVQILVDAVRSQTNRQESCAIVYIGENLYNECVRRLLGATSGLLTTLMDWIESQHKGDKTGRGAVEFRILNACEAAFRRRPETNADDSGIAGDFLFARPKEDKAMDAFMRARRFTQMPPKQEDFNVENLCHAKIGGWRTRRPLAFAMMVFE